MLGIVDQTRRIGSKIHLRNPIADFVATAGLRNRWTVMNGEDWVACRLTPLMRLRHRTNREDSKVAVHSRDWQLRQPANSVGIFNVCQVLMQWP